MHTECKSETGITIGLMDGLLAIAQVLVKRDWSSPEIQEVLQDLRQDDNLKKIMDIGELASAKSHILQQHKITEALAKALELSDSLAAKNSKSSGIAQNVP